jgi:hypothetical protein
MLNMGVDLENVQNFIKKMCVINSISNEYQEILLSSVNNSFEIQNENIQNKEVIFLLKFRKVPK